MALQFPHINRPVSLGNTLSNALTEAYAMQRQREADMAEKLKTAYGMNRQRQGDQQADMLKARELMQAGDVAGAMSIMARHGGQQEQYEVPGQPAPKQAVTVPQARPQETADPNLSDPNEISQSVADADWKATAPNPIAAAYQAQQKRMATRLTGKFEDGTEWSLDPEAAQRTRQERLQQSFGQSSDPDVRGMLPQLEAAYGASMQEPDPKEIFGQLRNTTNARRQDAAMDRRHQETLDREDRRNAEWDRRFPQQEAGRDRRAQLGAGLRGATVRQGDERIALSTEAAAREAASRVLSNLKANEVIIADRKYSDMLANIQSSPNAALDAATGGQWVKLAQGGTGVISDSDMRVFWQQIGGVGDYVEGKVQGLINGQIAAGKRDIVAQAMRQLASRAQTNLAGIQRAMEHQFDQSPNLRGYKDQMVGTYFPGYRRASQAGQSAKGKQGAAASDDYMQMYRELRGDR